MKTLASCEHKTNENHFWNESEYHQNEKKKAASFMKRPQAGQSKI
jgi:hypothetical protein